MHVGIFCGAQKRTLNAQKLKLQRVLSQQLGCRELHSEPLKGQKVLINHRALFPPSILMFNLKLLNNYWGDLDKTNIFLSPVVPFHCCNKLFTYLFYIWDEVFPCLFLVLLPHSLPLFPPPNSPIHFCLGKGRSLISFSKTWPIKLH